MLTRALFVLFVAGCHGDDPGFDLVHVPQSAYVMPKDAASEAEAAASSGDGGNPVIVCIKELEEAGEDGKVSTDYPTCMLEYEGRRFDSRVTERHRKKDDESEVCCYRR
jgi:hypothetical protein